MLCLRLKKLCSQNTLDNYVKWIAESNFSTTFGIFFQNSEWNYLFYVYVIDYPMKEFLE